MVLFGVLAALLVDEWRQVWQARAESQVAMERVVAEVRANLTELLALDSVVTVRIGLMEALEPELDGSVALDALASRFHGYRVPDLSHQAWQRLTTGRIADQVPGDFLQDGFGIYSFNARFTRLESEMTDLVFSEANFDPRRVRIGWLTAHEIMIQQVAWAHASLPRYEAFLERWGDGPGD